MHCAHCGKKPHEGSFDLTDTGKPVHVYKDCVFCGLFCQSLFMKRLEFINGSALGAVAESR